MRIVNVVDENESRSRLFDSLIRRVKDLNEEISKDESLGAGFCIWQFTKLGEPVFLKNKGKQEMVILGIEEYAKLKKKTLD